MTKRLNYFDIAKGIGIVLVVFGHSYRGLESSNQLEINKQIFHDVDTFVYSFHMPLFFLISGIFFSKSILKYNNSELILQKCKTILWPYIVWSLIQTLIEIILSKYTNAGIGISSILTCLFYPRAQFWFLFALFFINLIDVILLKLSKKGIYIGLLLSIFICIILPNNLGIYIKIFQHLIFFNVGILMSSKLLNVDLILKYSKNKYLALISIFFLAIEFFLIFVYPGLSGSILTYIVTGIIGTILVILFSYKISNISALANIFVRLGQESLQIYILHILCTAGIRIMLFKLFNIHNTFIHLFIETIFGIIIPYIAGLLFNKTKYGRYFFSLD